MVTEIIGTLRGRQRRPVSPAMSQRLFVSPATTPASSPAIGAKIHPRKFHVFLVRNQKRNRDHLLSCVTSSVQVIWSAGFASALTGNSLSSSLLSFSLLLLPSPSPLIYSIKQIVLLGGDRRLFLSSTRSTTPPTPLQSLSTAAACTTFILVARTHLVGIRSLCL